MQTYADVAFRIEDVNFYNFRYPAPADYLAAAGHTTLATIRPSLRFDNRNDPFAASPFFRIVETAPGRWKVYRALAPGDGGYRS